MNFRKYAGIILNILVPLLTVCVWGLRLVVFFLPFVIGWIVAAIANPVVRFFEKRLKIVRRHGSMVLIAGVLALVIFGIYALFSWVFREMTEFGQALPGIYASIREEVDLACERIGGLLKTRRRRSFPSWRMWVDISAILFRRLQLPQAAA